MRKFSLFLLLLVLFPTTVFAQGDRDEDWRRRRSEVRRDTFELTPFIGYRWGGTIFADRNFIFGENVEVEPSANFGASLGIPLGDSGFKLELLADRQSSDLELQSGLFDPTTTVAEIDVTYLHAGLQIPFARSRNTTPYVVVSAGLANLDPQISGVSAENRFSASAGIGVKTGITDNLAFKFEGRGFYTALEENDDCFICDYTYNQDFYQAEVNLGLVFSF